VPGWPASGPDGLKRFVPRRRSSPEPARWVTVDDDDGGRHRGGSCAKVRGLFSPPCRTVGKGYGVGWLPQGKSLCVRSGTAPDTAPRGRRTLRENKDQSPSWAELHELSFGNVHQPRGTAG
jgi:hypothetical protein